MYINMYIYISLYTKSWLRIISDFADRLLHRRTAQMYRGTSLMTNCTGRPRS